MLIRRATLLDGTTADIRVGVLIDEVGDGLAAAPGERVLDAAGGTVLPGLHDHHVHLRSAAAALDSLLVGPPGVGTKEQLAQALCQAGPSSDGWIRAIGYHESVAGRLDRDLLDAMVPVIPLRIQHRSGALWILNSAALGRIGLAGHPDGRLHSADPSWSAGLPRRETNLARLSGRLTSMGVTGVTDATPDLSAADMESLQEAHRRGEFRPRIRFLAPGKKILHDDRLDLDALTVWISDCHRAGRPVAVHCVTAAQLVVTIAALRAAGSHPLDRIEHAAVVPDDTLTDLCDLGATVVSQPNFVAERGDQYFAEIPAAEHHQLWRIASLLNATVPMALSTDMPFGRDDPWAAMRAAVRRITASGAVLNSTECISARTALAMFLGRPDRPGRGRTITPGQPGDLCVLSQPPAAALAQLDSALVAATIIGGEIVYASRECPRA
ncbi:amidohydrolase [Mycobacterium kansasii]|uniref:N-substituted formamide deformylase n=1 Tax=Mycobacterium attenuatum TaxID=2341086 RepID=A0A498PQA4_9MYCO|nr:amidohydrolase family protein [Mycobacterium attenuatum]ORB85076.1 amidohydrolase [Mycobacterium kansasii]VBA32701.1 N-substituted formamide deformylase [Mycobacterium attenuatum]VBA45175.1 N-substituted formamide deformylase [Mycobacterium attenuatum]VBA46389.1 N-substituted formamide deformylase [Mycobacterium attenuatum]